VKNRKITALWLIGTCLVLLLAGMIAGACAPAPAPTTPATPAAPAAPAPVAPIKIIIASQLPPQDHMVGIMQEWGSEFEKKAGGKYKVEYSFGGALGPGPEYINLVQKGVCDVAYCMPAMIAGSYPVTEMLTLPWAMLTPVGNNKAMWEFYKAGYLDKDYANMKVLFYHEGTGYALYTAKKPVNTLADLKGLKIRTTGGNANPIWEALGGVPVFMASGDVYGAVQKGTVDGVATAWESLLPMKWIEVVPYATVPELGNTPWAMVMNKDTYNKMPKDIQAIVDGMANSGDYGIKAGSVTEKAEAASKNALTKGPGKIINWSSADFAKIEGLLAPIWAKYIADMEAKGVPAKKACNAFYDILKKAGIEKPAYGYTPIP
jgi:TRAP-type C4-dicarboxylate transport system substrate-binding protein